MILRPVKPEKAFHLTGWIAPNGDFYPCSITQHDRVCLKLAEQFYLMDKRRKHFCRDLTEYYWIRLSTKGLCHGHVDRMGEGTQKQFDTLNDILVLWMKEEPDGCPYLHYALEEFQVVEDLTIF